jgi:prevent-host-death family protein
MSETVNICDARTRLSQLLDRVARGEDVIIARAGRPVARLVAFRPKYAVRQAGRMRGAIRASRDFDAPLPSDLFDDGDK